MLLVQLFNFAAAARQVGVFLKKISSKDTGVDRKNEFQRKFQANFFCQNPL